MYGGRRCLTTASQTSSGGRKGLRLNEAMEIMVDHDGGGTEISKEWRKGDIMVAAMVG